MVPFGNFVNAKLSVRMMNIFYNRLKRHIFTPDAVGKELIEIFKRIFDDLFKIKCVCLVKFNGTVCYLNLWRIITEV